MQTTTVSDLIQFLTQLNTGNAAPAPAAAPAANAAPAPAAAPAANAAPAPIVAPAPNVAPAPAVAPAANAAPAPNVAPAPAVAPAANVAPAPAVAPAANVAPAPANAPGNAAPAPFSAVFRCPACDTVHFLGPVNASAVPGAAPAAPGPAAAPAANPGPAAPAVPAGNQAGPSNTAGRWYSVTHGRQIGVFRDWYGVVDPLVNGVPDWRCKSFSTYAAAANHFNAHLAAGMARVYNEPSVEAGDAVDAE